MVKQSIKSTNYKKLSVSLIATVLNELQSIEAFLDSYKQQTLLASQFIIVDAGSTDGTAQLIEKFAKKNRLLKIELVVLENSTRGQARNAAVAKAKGEWLAFTDAGCVLESDWLEQLVMEQVHSQQQVVGGWFRGLAQSRLQEAMVPYFLQLPRQLSTKNFIPTSRSLLISKKAFDTVRGFKEELILSEDYDLMLRLRAEKISWALARRAIVNWFPPKNYRTFLWKIAAFAASDIEAGIVRPKVLSIYGRYLVFLTVSIWSISLAVLLLLLYFSWSIIKNYHNCPDAWYYLPFLQFSTDMAIMVASLFAIRNFNSRVA